MSTEQRNEHGYPVSRRQDEIESALYRALRHDTDGLVWMVARAVAALEESGQLVPPEVTHLWALVKGNEG